MGCKRIVQCALNSTAVQSAPAGVKLQYQLFNSLRGLRVSRLDIIYIDGSGAPTAFSNAFGDIELTKNNKTFRIHSAAELDHLNGINGSQYLQANLVEGAAAAERQCAPIFFMEPWRKNLVQADSMSVNVDSTYGWTGFGLNLTPLINLPATAQILILAYVDNLVTNATAGAAQTIKQVLRLDLGANGNAGDYDQFPAAWNYQALYIKNPSGAGSGYAQYATLKIGGASGTVYRDKIVQQDNISAMEGAGLIPSTSQAVGAFGYDLVLDWDDPLQSVPPSGSQPWLHLDYSAASNGTVRILCEVLGPVQN